jgi:ankyrin repeat protein
MYLKSKKKNYDQHEAVKHVNLKQIKNQRGDSLLHISVLENYIELVEYLLNKGLDVNSQNEDVGIGDWGLGIGPIPNPQSPIPNPHYLF